jgi:hypothetical protein
MPTTPTRKRSRKPVTTRQATAAELDPRTGRERKEAAAAKRRKPAAVPGDARGTLVRKRRKPTTKATAKPVASPHDFSIAGLRVHNARQENGAWYVDLSNGDRTATLHNRHGSWMADVAEGRMAEPVRVARALGITSMSNYEVAKLLLERVQREDGTSPRSRRNRTTAAPAAENTTNNTTTEEATMAKPTTGSTKRKPKAKAKPAPAAEASNGTGRTRAPAFTMTKKEAKEVAKRLRDGETMKSIREEYGHSDGSKVRAALREHGFGSKGQSNPEGLTPTEWRAKYGDGEGTTTKRKPKAKPAKAAPEPEAEEEDLEEEEEEENGDEAEETPDDRRKRLRREARQRRNAKAKPKARSRKPKAKAADPS